MRNVRSSDFKLLLAIIAFLQGPQLAAQNARSDSLFKTIQWSSGPGKILIGSFVEFSIPADCRFSDRAGARTFMELTENPPGDNDGILLCPASDETNLPWFVMFRYDASGYVKDDESKSLDAAQILETLRRGNAEGNKERISRGWDTLHIVGWETPPYYDPLTHNLTWAANVSSSQGVSINHSVRLLGRGGVLHAELVIDPKELSTAMPRFAEALAGTTFVKGQTYSEWRPGDKLAEYGLTALIAGGAGAAAVKLGLFGKLWKLVAALFIAVWKLLVVTVLGVVGWIRSLFRRKTKKLEAPGEQRGPKEQ